MSKKNKDPQLPQVDLKQGDFATIVPDNLDLCITVVWKNKNAENEQIGPVKMFGIKDGKLKIINRALPDVAYTFHVKEIRKAIIL